MTRVLVVDDKEEALYYLEALLGGHGYEVTRARHGAEALVVGRDAPPDLVVSDLLMPVMDGYTLLRHWKADPRLREIPFVVYTATYTDAEDERLALSLGADAFLLKPAEPDVLLDALRDVQRREQVARPVGADDPGADEEVLRTYSETLIRKLEEKTLQLEQTNPALERDIAARARMEQALRERDRELELLITSIPHIVWVASADGSAVDMNERWTEVTGLPPDPTNGGQFMQSVHPEDQADARDRWRKAMAEAEPFEVELRIRYADDRYHWMLALALPFLDDDGRIVKWYGTFTDIDELKRAHGRIAAQARLLDLAQDAITVQTTDHRILYWNQSAERIFGWSAVEALGHATTELHVRDTDQLAAVHDALATAGEWSGELRFVDRDGGDVIVESRWTVIPARDEEAQQAILVVSTDVTERKRIEAQFLRAQRLESIGTIAGGMAHDLNNLLAPVLMGADLLRMQVSDDTARELVDTIETSAQRAADLVQRVLSFARGAEGDRVPVRLGDVVAEVAAMADRTFPRDIIVRTEVPGDLWPVVGDPTQLNQVLLNLCVNARDAMPDGGLLSIRARNLHLDPRTIVGEVADTPVVRERYVVLDVGDDGVGIAPDLTERIFEPFTTTKDPGSGTGLGLSTVVGIVKGHEGFVTVDSEVGVGSVFSVYLPADGVEDVAAGDAQGLRSG